MGGICGRILKAEGWPEEWKEGVIVPIVKKECGEVLEEYRSDAYADALQNVGINID